MAVLTLSEAASIVGVNKATLWRAIKQGRLSAHREADKSYRIEESELLRVFPGTGRHHAGNSGSLTSPEHATLQIDMLKAQVDLLHRQLKDMQRDKQWLMQRIETLKATQQCMLPAQAGNYRADCRSDRTAEATKGKHLTVMAFLARVRVLALGPVASS